MNVDSAPSRSSLWDEAQLGVASEGARRGQERPDVLAPRGPSTGYSLLAPFYDQSGHKLNRETFSGSREGPRQNHSFPFRVNLPSTTLLAWRRQVGINVARGFKPRLLPGKGVQLYDGFFVCSIYRWKNSRSKIPPQRKKFMPLFQLHWF